MTLDQNSADYPHGTLEGVQGGCKSSQCTAVMKCREVRIRYAGDFGFKKHMDAGLSAAEFVALELEAAQVVRAVRVPRPKAVRKVTVPRVFKTDSDRADEEALRVLVMAERKAVRLAKREAVIAERAAFTLEERAKRAAARAEVVAERKAARRALRPLSPVPHGSAAGYARKCRCEPCKDAYRASQRVYRAKARARPIALENHGSAHGYQLGCRAGAVCPTLPSCADVSLAAETRRRRESGVAERGMIPAGPVIAHIVKLHKSMTYVEIGAATGIAGKDIRRMVTGRDSGDRMGELPKHTDRVKAALILAVAS